MKDNVTAMFKPNKEMAADYAQQITERTLGLARSQLEVTENMYLEATREYRELLVAEGPSAMVQSWPKMLERATRTSTEGIAEMLKNAMNYQTEILQMMQSRVPELGGQMVDSLVETTRAAGAKAEAATGRSSRHGGNHTRSSKAA